MLALSKLGPVFIMPTSLTIVLFRRAQHLSGIVIHVHTYIYVHITIIIFYHVEVVRLQNRNKVTIEYEYMTSYVIDLIEIFALTADSHLTTNARVKACCRKREKPRITDAVDSIVTEADIATTSDDVSFDDFFTRAGDQIRDIVNEYQQRYRY